MGHVAYETTHVAVLDELRHALSDVVDEAHWVPQEVHRAQDLRCLADELLQTANTPHVLTGASGAHATTSHLPT